MHLSLEKPTITTSDQPTLLVTLADPGWHHFDWVLTGPIVGPARPRVQSGSRSCSADLQEYSVLLQPIKTAGAYQISVTPVPTGSVESGESSSLETGEEEDATASADPPKDSTASVALVVIEADQAFGGLRNPLFVELTSSHEEEATVDPSRFVNFRAFQNQVLFNQRNTYEARYQAAIQYVQAHRIAALTDLMPDGYLRQRADAALDPRTAWGQIDQLPAVELIWNYWQEEGMLVQTLNVILARFENRRLPDRHPLKRFDVTPLLPLRNLLWGFSEAEMKRTTLRRRAAEYEYEYGLSLIGRAVPGPQSNVERRSNFLGAFHEVLHAAHVFYKDSDDRTVNPDGYPLFQTLRDCHLVLAQGSQNQYNSMAVTARAEFLVAQSILAEKEMREFLGGRPMTPYPEEWMDRVDSMKSIQGWDDASVIHYHDLATLGEELVMTIRLGNWAATGVGGLDARRWAITFRQAVQRYTSAYRSVTGVDLTTQRNTAELPSRLIARKLAYRRRMA